MVWSNYYLIPIVLVGGLLAYMLGQTVIGGVLARVRSVLTPRAKPEPVYIDRPRHDEPRHEQPIYTPPAKSNPKRLLAERREDWEDDALSVEDQREALADKMRALDLEEARRAALREEYRKASKSTNVLKGKLDIAPTAGPLTTAMAMGDAMQEILRAAAAERDATAPK